MTRPENPSKTLQQQIADQLKAARENPIEVRSMRTLFTWEESVQIAKQGNTEFFEKLSMGKGDGLQVVVQHNGRLPLYVDAEKDNRSSVMKVNRVDRSVYDIMMDALESYRLYTRYHLSAYEFLMVYCLAKGIDLVEEGIIDL